MHYRFGISPFPGGRVLALNHTGIPREPIRWCNSQVASESLREVAPRITHDQALQLMQAAFGSAAFNLSITSCSAFLADAAACAVPVALRTLSTSTVNLMASTAAFVRK